MVLQKSGQTPVSERVRAESEKRYAILFQGSADPLLIMKHNFIDCNEEACLYLGYSREEIIGHPPNDFSPDYQPDGRKSAEAAAEYLKSALEGLPQTFYWQHLHRNGKLLDTEVRLRKVDLEGKTLLIASVRDISERLKAEEIVRQGRDWYRALAEDIPVLVTRIAPDGKITYVNEASRAIIDRPVEEIIGSDFFSLAPAEYLSDMEKSFKALTPEDPLVVFDHYNKGRLFRWKNRAVFNPDQTVKEYFTVGEDITEQHQAALKLRESEARNRALVDAIPDKIFRYDREGNYLDVQVKDEKQLTEKARNLYLRGQLIGSNITDFFSVEIADLLMGGIEAALQTGDLQVLEYDYVTAEERRYFEARLIAMGDEQVISIVRDITDRHQALELLKESEERYREILATIEEGYYESDLSGVITFCNDAAGRLFGGYSQKELIGMSYKKFYKNPELAYETFNRVFMTGVPEKGLILEMIKKDGTISFGEISISLIKDKEGFFTGFKGIGKDVTDRIEYEKRLEYLSLHDQLTGIHNRAFYEAELERLEGGREYPVTIITADLDGLKLINDTLGHDTGDRLLCRCAGILRESLRQSDLLARIGGDEFSAILRRTDHATGEAIMRRIREKINLINQDDDDVPLGISIGIATAEDKDVALNDVYKHADDSMYRDKLYRSSSSRGKIVQSLLAALAERDYITEGHARRLEDLCRAIGEKIDLSSHQLTDLALLAQVHDLGKVGIPDQILYKPGPLNDEEWEVMRGHPEKGYRIASASPDLAGVADLILKHHERWDGSGYPLGLKGKEIPVECRIMAIIDAFDAMTNKRPYNEVKTQQEALAEIKRGSGSQFDPELVKIFLTVIDEE
jgi:diguanylate cyclase (GGDEF)-like protein/PAS domain S-box-containing protein